MDSISSFRKLIETVQAEQEVYQIKLPVKENEITSVISKETMELHYGTLYKNYVKKSLAGEGRFQTAGAKLHTLYFEQFKVPSVHNIPDGPSKILIDKKFGSFSKFKDEFTEQALGIHGSGWIYLTTSGGIKIIPNHELIDNVAFILDMWEHAYIIDYGAKKEKYINSFWKIVNWNIVNLRLNNE